MHQELLNSYRNALIDANAIEDNLYPCDDAELGRQIAIYEYRLAEKIYYRRINAFGINQSGLLSRGWNAQYEQSAGITKISDKIKALL